MIDFNAIRFPVEGTVNRIVHFSDTFHQYAFSFVSPFVYHQPAEYQKKGAFLVAKYNPFNPDIDAPEEIYRFFIPEDESRKVLLDKKRNLTARRVHLYSADEEPLGAVEVLYPNHRLFSLRNDVSESDFRRGRESDWRCAFSAGAASEMRVFLREGF